MSSTSPGHHFAQKQFNSGSAADFHHSVTSPDGSYVITRQLPGYPDGSEICSRDSGYSVNTSDGASTCSSSTTDATEGEGGTLLVLEPKSLRSFTTNDEYLYAMKEDLADWFSCLYKFDITADTFFSVLETGVLLCQHANKVQDFSRQRREQGEALEMRSYFIRNVPAGNVMCRENVKPETFQARDNVSNFISWGRQLGIPEVLSFETDDLVLRKNEKSVILCLLEIARVGAKLGMLAPTLVQMEQEIDAELAGEEVKPKAQIKTCDMRSLDEMVRDLIGRCTCPVQFPMVKVGDGKYKIGDSRSLIFVRILRNHVMVRVGGGWDTLENYLNKHDPCQCNYRGHRATSLGPKVGQKPTANATASQLRPGNTVVSPRRMSTPAVSMTPTPGRNRSSSPKHQLPTRSKSPTLVISRHMQGNQRPCFSVNNNNSGSNSNGKAAPDNNNGMNPVSSSVDLGHGATTTSSRLANSSTNQNNASSGVPEVSKSWSQTSGVPTSKIPTVGGGGHQANRSKSPSPAPSANVSRLRSPSPRTASITESAQHRGHHSVVTRAASSSALLPKAKGPGGGVKVGTPRSIKRDTMKRRTRLNALFIEYRSSIRAKIM